MHVTVEGHGILSEPLHIRMVHCNPPNARPCEIEEFNQTEKAAA